MQAVPNLCRYLSYCRSEGTFRKESVPVPTHAEARKDAAALCDGPAWKAIKWDDSGEGWSYAFSEEWVWKFIQAQADRIK